MGFDDLINKGKEYYSNNKDEVNKYAGEAKDAYDSFNKTEGSFTDKAKGAYSEFQNHGSSGSGSTEANAESKAEDKA